MVDVDDEIELTKNRVGVIRYKGPLEGKNGIFYGVELLKGSGKHSGLFKGQRYFLCPKGKGVFIDKKSILYKLEPSAKKDAVKPRKPKKSKFPKKMFNDEETQQEINDENARILAELREEERRRAEMEAEMEQLRILRLQMEEARKMSSSSDLSPSSSEEQQAHKRRKRPQPKRPQPKRPLPKRPQPKRPQPKRPLPKRPQPKRKPTKDYKLFYSVNIQTDENDEDVIADTAILKPLLADLFETRSERDVFEIKTRRKNDGFNIQFGVVIATSMHPADYIDTFDDLTADGSFQETLKEGFELSKPPDAHYWEARYEKIEPRKRRQKNISSSEDEDDWKTHHIHHQHQKEPDRIKQREEKAREREMERERKRHKAMQDMERERREDERRRREREEDERFRKLQEEVDALQDDLDRKKRKAEETQTKKEIEEERRKRELEKERKKFENARKALQDERERAQDAEREKQKWEDKLRRVRAKTAAEEEKQNKHPKEWRVDEVVAWICSIDNGKYKRYKINFIENEVDGDDLQCLDADALHRDGIKKASHQRDIIRAIKALLRNYDDIQGKSNESRLMQSQYETKHVQSEVRYTRSLIVVENVLIIIVAIGEYMAADREDIFDVCRDVANYRNVLCAKYKYKFMSSVDMKGNKGYKMNKSDIERYISECLAELIGGTRIRPTVKYDALLVAFSGHGTIDSIVCSDSKMIKYSTIRGWFHEPVLRRIPQFFCVDACRVMEDKKEIDDMKQAHDDDDGLVSRGSPVKKAPTVTIMGETEGQIVRGGKVSKYLCRQWNREFEANKFNEEPIYRPFGALYDAAYAQVENETAQKLTVAEYDRHIDDVVFTPKERDRGTARKDGMEPLIDDDLRNILLPQKDSKMSSKMNLLQYFFTLFNNGYRDNNALRALTKQKLNNLRITKQFHQKELLRRVQRLKKQ
eukprot:144599_1